MKQVKKLFLCVCMTLIYACVYFSEKVVFVYMHVHDIDLCMRIF